LLALLLSQLQLSFLFVAFLFIFFILVISIFSSGLLCVVSFLRCQSFHRVVFLGLFHLLGNLLVESLENLHELGVGVGGLQLFYLVGVRVLELDFLALLLLVDRIWICSPLWLRGFSF